MPDYKQSDLAKNTKAHGDANRYPQSTTRPKFDPDAVAPARDVDALMDLLLQTLNGQMDILARQAESKGALHPNQMADLLKLSTAIANCYRARPGRAPDPLVQREGETKDEYRTRLENMK